MSPPLLELADRGMSTTFTGSFAIARYTTYHTYISANVFKKNAELG